MMKAMSGKTFEANLQRIVDMMREADSWVLVSHERPDGDTAGCAAALAEVASEIGMPWRWLGKDSLPLFLDFLPQVHRYEVHECMPPLDEGACVLCVDVSTPERAPQGLPAEGEGIPLIVVDHHSDNKAFGQVNLIDPTAAATGEIVWRLIQAAGWPVSPRVAESIYTALVTDCGRFSYSNTSPETHRIAAELLLMGARPASVFEKLFARAVMGKLHLWGIALRRAVGWCDGKVGVTYLLDKDFEETGTDRSHLEGLVNELLLLEGSEFAVLMTEQRETTYASLRSKGNVSAQHIATRWGGGGHPQAAAFRSRLPLHEVSSLLEDELEEAYAHGSAGH